MGSQREYDVGELNSKLADWKLAWDKREDLIVAPEDGVNFNEVIRAMDAAVAAGFPKLSVADAATMM